MGKIKGFWRGDGIAGQNGEALAAIRVRNVAPPDGDRLSMILPDFEENPGQPMGLQNGPFFVS